MISALSETGKEHGEEETLTCVIEIDLRVTMGLVACLMAGLASATG